jgi:hypothetical protein
MFKSRRLPLCLVLALTLSLVVFSAWAEFSQAEPLAKYKRVRILLLGWNVESGGNDPTVIADQLKAFEGYDLIGLTEVKKDNAAKYAQAAGDGEGAKGSAQADFKHKVSSTGGSDRMVIIWDNKRFKLIGDAKEITELSEGNHRAPFYAQFKIKGTPTEFIFMVNHLARGKSTLRQKQAKGLSDWAATQTLPIIAVGDYNFDYSVDTGEGNEGFNKMLEAGVFEWVVPDDLFKTQSTDRYMGVLDFMFIANKPANWKVSSKILTRENPFPDNDKTSDHRPIQGRVLIMPE